MLLGCTRSKWLHPIKLWCRHASKSMTTISKWNSFSSVIRSVWAVTQLAVDQCKLSYTIPSWHAAHIWLYICFSVVLDGDIMPLLHYSRCSFKMFTVTNRFKDDKSNWFYRLLLDNFSAAFYVSFMVDDIHSNNWLIYCRYFNCVFRSMSSIAIIWVLEKGRFKVKTLNFLS